MPTLVETPPLCSNDAMKRLLRACSPHYHPYRWLAVNCIVLLWSAILLVRIESTADSNNENEKTGIEFDYLVYNFGTCAVWLVEVLFNVLDHREYFESAEGTGEESLLRPTPKSERTKKEVIALYIEVALAVIFFVDSTTVAVHLSRRQIHRQAEGMTFDVCASIAAYSFLVYRQFVDWRGSGKEDDVNAEDSPAAEEQSEGLV